MTRRLDVIIAAHNQQPLIGACLRAVLRDADGVDLRVVVVANGCTDATVPVAKGFLADARSGRHDLIVIETPVAGRAGALNTGDAHRRGCAVFYLGADTVLTPGTLAALSVALATTPAARLVLPRPVPVRPEGRPGRALAVIRSLLSTGAGPVADTGCYAVNPAGRARWAEFPAHTGDDSYVRSRFAPSERIVVDGGGFFPVPWRGREWRRGAGRWRRDGYGWYRWPAGRSSAPIGARMTPRVDAVIVTYRNRSTIDSCVDSLRSRWAELTVTVVDNASGDGTVEHLRGCFPHVEVVRNRENVGFAAAVNQAADRGDGDYLLLFNPDAELGDRAIDNLLALATRFPAAGIYGGRPVDDAGRPDPNACLARPTLWHALAFGGGLSALRGFPVLDPDSLGGWRRDDVRRVPVLTGGLLLIDRALWRELGGFDDQYFLYGEDVDLCLRAAEVGATPMFTPTVGYRHRGGVSSSPVGRTVGILRGKATVYHAHLSPWRARLARRAMLAGVGLRAVAAGWVRSEQAAAVWAAAWRRRGEWVEGWPRRGSIR